MKKKVVSWGLCVATLLLGACSATSGILMAAPSARTSLQTTAGTPVARVFGCAEQRLEQLQANHNDFWKQAITVRDEARGLLETGNFPEDNVMGFRIHLHYQSTNGTIDLRLKGAGPYFTDLGVDKAMNDFKQGFQACIAAAR